MLAAGGTPQTEPQGAGIVTGVRSRAQLCPFGEVRSTGSGCMSARATATVTRLMLVVDRVS